VGEPVRSIARFLARFLILSVETTIVVALWVLASWMNDTWDRFPHLVIKSPEKRCAKSLFLKLLELITREPHGASNISPAAIYRLIGKLNGELTLLLDEAQSLSRRGSEPSEVLRELLNAGIDRNAKVIRCVGDAHDIAEFPTYCAKILALIGDLDSVLADRCLPIPMRRKRADEPVEMYRYRVVEPEGKALQDLIRDWTERHADAVSAIYDRIERLPIQNDRLADLMMPLQAVAEFVDPELHSVLKSYAEGLDRQDLNQERQSPGVRLLAACQEVFDENRSEFTETVVLINSLVARSEEPWSRWNHGKQITAEALANLLRPFGIRSSRDLKQKHRGYYRADFEESWSRYLHRCPKNPVEPV
jgi:hypothetical protein